MTDTDTVIERRLFVLAEDMLQDRPGAFSAFQQDNQNRSWYATTLSASLPSEFQLRILSLYGPLKVCRIIDPPLQKFIDEWTECYVTAPCVAPLPALPPSVRKIANLEAVPVEQAANPTAAKVEAGAGTTPAPATRTNKLRRNNLDPAIDKAINMAGNMELADVYLQLKELAISGEKPFTGEVTGDMLHYTNDENKPDTLSKEQLRKRLDTRKRNAV